MRRINVSIAFLGLLVMWGCSDVIVSEAEARELGAKTLARYCETHNLSPKSFQLVKVGPSGPMQWDLVYVSSGLTPQREVSVGITKKGGIEISTDFEGRDGQEE